MARTMTFLVVMALVAHGGCATRMAGADIFLIVSATGNLKPVTDGEFSIPKQVRWHEAEGFAEIEYIDEHPNSRIALK